MDRSWSRLSDARSAVPQLDQAGKIFKFLSLGQENFSQPRGQKLTVYPGPHEYLIVYGGWREGSLGPSLGPGRLARSPPKLG
jgi:hypothetical protein